MLTGKSFTRWLPSVQFPGQVWIGAPALPAHNSDPSAGGSTHDSLIDLALRAATEAISDAKLEITRDNRDRVGCVVGTSKGGLHAFQQAWEATYRHPSASPSPTDAAPFSHFLPNGPARQIAARFDLRGPSLCPVAACATGLVSVARGADLVSQGRCDFVLAGSADASLVDVVQASFRRLGVLASHTQDPQTACRPFDRDRSGFVIGEGGAILVLERAESARARSVVPYATWLAGGLAGEATHLARLNDDPADLARLITTTLKSAGIAPDEIDYINYHGTATRQNDRLETAAVKRALGKAADRVAGSSLKGALGHLLGAAGSVELAGTLLALRDGIVPPTVNLFEADPACDLDYTPGQACERRLQTALKLSLGFGGHLACAIVRREM